MGGHEGDGREMGCGFEGMNCNEDDERTFGGGEKYFIDDENDMISFQDGEIFAIALYLKCKINANIH